MPLTTTTVTGSYPTGAGGQQAQGYVEFVPTARVVSSSGQVIIPQVPVQATLSQGKFSLPDVYTTDNSGLAPSGWAWQITEYLTGAPANSYDVFIPSSFGETVDLSELTKAVPGPVVTAYAILDQANLFTESNTFDGPLIIPTGAEDGYVWTSDAGGDGSWQPGGGGSGDVNSVFGRTGTVTARTGDYSFSQVSGAASIAQGGTGQTAQAAALTALAGTQSAGEYLRSDGTNTALHAIVAADVPTLNQSTTGTAAGLSSTLAISSGGTGATTQQGAINALTGTQSAGEYLRSNGTDAALSAIQAGDVPTLNQNTTGSAASASNATAVGGITVTGTPTTGQVLTATSGTAADWQATGSAPVSSVFGRTGAVIATSGDYSFSEVSGTASISQGGTGQTGQQAALNALAGAETSGYYLRGNGTNVTMSAVQAADVPILNQNTTGNAATATSATTAANATAIDGVTVTGTPSAGQALIATGTAAAGWSSVVNTVNGATGTTLAAYPLDAVAIRTSATVSVAANTIAPLDTTSNSITANLVAAPPDRTVAAIKLVIQGAGNNVTIACGGSDVFNKTGGSTTLTLSLPNQGVLLQYSTVLGGWYNLADDLPLSQTDARYLQLANASAQTVTGPVAFSAEVTAQNPVNPTDVVILSYLQGLINGLQYKGSVTLATTAALPTNTYNNGSSGVGATITAVATGPVTADGTVLAAGMTLLAQNEAAAANNGTYTVTVAGGAGVALVLTRAANMNTAADFPGALVAVEAGTANGGLMFIISGAGPFTVGTTAVNWVKSGVSSFSQLSGTAAINQGGTGQTSASAAFNALSPNTTLGDLTYGSGANTSTRLAGNTTATKNYLVQTGTGTVSAAPTWGAITIGDLPAGVLLTTGAQTAAGLKTFTTGISAAALQLSATTAAGDVATSDGSGNMSWANYGSSNGPLNPSASRFGLVAETISPLNCNLKGNLTSGTLFLVLLWWPAGKTISKLSCYVSTAGGTLTGVNSLGLYSSTGTLLSTTADMTAAFGSTGWQESTLATPQSPTADTVYYAGVLTHSSSLPAILAYNLSNAFGPINSAYGAISFATQTTHASFTPSAGAAATGCYFFGAR